MNGEQTRTEVNPEVVFLGKLVDRLSEGKIRIPRFQRAFVWNHRDMINLLDSVFRGFPIGAILVWDSDSDIKTRDRVGPVKIDSPSEGSIGYLLDGQQRLSTLVGTLYLPENVDTLDGIDWRVYCDLETLEFTHAPKTGLEAKHFPVRSLLNTKRFFESCRQIQKSVKGPKVADLLNAADRLANAFRDYQLPLIRIREASLDSAVTVFARLNRRGRKMTADEMVSALTYREGEFHLAAKLDELQGELKHRGFGGLDRVFVLRVVLAALDQDIYAREWTDILVKQDVREKLPDAFDVAVEAIMRALDFLEELGATCDRLLPYGLQLVMLAEFFRLSPTLPEAIRPKLERWFWVTSFTGWFGGVNTTQARLALEEIQALARGEDIELSIVDLAAPSQPFPERFDARSARVRAFLLYLTSLQPQSLYGSKPLNPEILLSELGPQALAYVSSNSKLLGELYSSPANRMFVDRQHTGRQAFVRLRDEVDNLEEVLVSHGFPRAAAEDIRRDDRTSAVRKRLQHLIDDERKFLQSKGVTLPTQRTALPVADSDTSDASEDDDMPGDTYDDE